MRIHPYPVTVALLLPFSSRLPAAGLELSFNNPTLDVSLDYRLQGDFADNDLAQVIDTSLRSLEFNNLLNIDAVVEADSEVKMMGESYHHALASAFSRPITPYANLNFEYRYTLDKPSAFALEQQITGYTLALDGQLAEGRFTFHSDYGQTDYKTSHTMTMLNFSSRYRVLSDMHIDLSGAVTQRRYWEDAGAALTERRYGVRLFWSPLGDYSFAVKLNGLDTPYNQHSAPQGSGSITWTPQPYWQFELSYDAPLAGDMQSLVLRARLDLGSG